MRDHRSPMLVGAAIVGAAMGLLAWASVAGVLPDRIASAVLIVNLPALFVAVIASGNLHDPSTVAFVLVAALQGAGIGALVGHLIGHLIGHMTSAKARGVR